jgi:hypothetical protein
MPRVCQRTVFREYDLGLQEVRYRVVLNGPDYGKKIGKDGFTREEVLFFLFNHTIIPAMVSTVAHFETTLPVSFAVMFRTKYRRED